MNRQQKLEAILERLQKRNVDIDGGHISAMIITRYLCDLADLGLIESAWTMTPAGKTISAVCEEFDWKPDDDEIKAFVMEMIDRREQPPFMYMLKKYRDDREGLIEDFKKAKEQMGEEPPTFS